ncbi:endonuclease V [Candidatus Bathyarchaeota archaeon A05DMB-2]|jgi:deoxyribonuclease V|nr:endonuclease V [Candidatus Bathyarchaeota archaeon A05DMB-2]
MNPPLAKLHNFSIAKAHEAQKRLSRKIITEDRLPKKITCIAGVDVAYLGSLAVGAVAVLNYESLELLESQTVVCEVKIPYIPTLLSFREIPPSVSCIRKLKSQPDVFLVDGHGMAHPYRCGFASHLGLAVGKPTVGVAKEKLVGTSVEAAGEIFLVHDGETVGSIVNTKKGAKPVFVSVGHMVSLGTAVKVVKQSVCNSRIPEPLRLAHEIATKEKRLLS